MKTTLVLIGCLVALGLSACSDDSAEDCARVMPALSAEGIVVQSVCAGVELTLKPEVRINDEWVAAAQCESLGTDWTCGVAERGLLLLTSIGDGFSTSFEASEEVVVEGLRFVGAGTIKGRTSWLSNGFQSWSHSGMLALNAGSSDSELLKALTAQGDEEVLREGRQLSWWHTLIGSQDGGVLVAGVREVERWRSWVQVTTPSSSAKDEVGVVLGCGGAGEGVFLAAGESVASEVWFVAAGNDVHAVQRAYAAQVVTREKDIRVEAELGWNSWYDLWDSVSAEDVVANAALAKSIFETDGQSTEALRIVVDDGWQKAWGVWETNEKFPDGLDGLAAALTPDGFSMGVWLAPLLMDPNSELAIEHPEWLVDGAAFLHPVHGSLRVLDVTHPEAAAHLQNVIRTIVGWGYGLLKIDFLFAGAFSGGRHQAMMGMEAYALAMDLIREAAGEDTLLLAVGAPGVPSMKWADSWRVGPDIAFEPTDVNWHFIPAQARTFAARWHLCERILCDADPVLLRGLPQNEVEVAGWVAAMSGGAFFLSDDLREVDTERTSWGVSPARVELGIGGVPVVPQDIFLESPPRELSSIVNDIIRGETTHWLPNIWELPTGEELSINFHETELSVGADVMAPRSVKLSTSE